jgi:hypothetical protein
MEFYSAWKKKEFMQYETIQVDLKDIMLIKLYIERQVQHESTYMRYWNSQTHKITARNGGYQNLGGW